MATAIPAPKPEVAARLAGTITVEVLAAVPATRDAVTFVLAAPGTRQAPAAYRAGQFITLAFAARDGSKLYRSYSLNGDGRLGAPWEITVKRTPGGVISNFLIDKVRAGTRLQSSLPQGNFTLPSALRTEATIVFVAGGSGITPIYAMLRRLAQHDPARRPRVALHYAYHSPADAIFGRELAALDPEGTWLTQRHYVSTNGQRLQPEQVLATQAATEWYVCGPVSLKHSFDTAATRYGIPEARRHAEVFASPATREAAKQAASSASGAGRLRLADTGAVLDTQAGETLLETLERHGYAPDFSCRAGACGTCQLRLLAGHVRNGEGDNGALSPSERATGYILSCVAQPQGDVVLASGGSPPGGSNATRTAASGGRRSTGKRGGLRLGLAAATLGLFIGMWGLTNHTPASLAQTTTTTTSSSTTTTSSSDDTSATSSSSSSSTSSGSSSTSGTSSATTQGSQGSTSTSTGTS